MIDTFGIFFMLALTLFPVSFNVAPDQSTTQPQHITPEEPIIPIDSHFTAKSILLFDFNDDHQLVNYNSYDRLPIASLTKIMTGYLALKELSPDSHIHMSKDAAETEGAIGHFSAGENFFMRDILEAAMTASSNDSAMALAETVGEKKGGTTFDDRIKVFTDLMNSTAKSLGMDNTTFVNPTGLDRADKTPSNYSTANDLAKLLRATRSETPLLWDLSRDQTKTIYALGGAPHFFFNINALAGHIQNFIGGKTGSTNTARESVIVLFEAPLGNPRGLILLGAEPGGSRFTEAEEILNHITTVLP